MKNASKGLLAIFFVSIFFVIAYAYSLNKISKEVESKKNEVLIIEPIKIEEIKFQEGSIAHDSSGDDFSKVAYEVGYKQGYVYFIQQFHFEIGKSDPQTVYTYTINDQEKQIQSDENYQKIITKGYIDGYHKASDAMFCPACPR